MIASLNFSSQQLITTLLLTLYLLRVHLSLSHIYLSQFVLYLLEKFNDIDCVWAVSPVLHQTKKHQFDMHWVQYLWVYVKYLMKEERKIEREQIYSTTPVGLGEEVISACCFISLTPKRSFTGVAAAWNGFLRFDTWGVLLRTGSWLLPVTFRERGVVRLLTNYLQIEQSRLVW